MGWVSGPSLTAATSNAGGLGILASATMTYAELEAAIAKTKSLTNKPFGVNMRADAIGRTQSGSICSSARRSRSRRSRWRPRRN